MGYAQISARDLMNFLALFGKSAKKVTTPECWLFGVVRVDAKSLGWQKIGWGGKKNPLVLKANIPRLYGRGTFL